MKNFAEINDTIRGFIGESPLNTVEGLNDLRIYDLPLVGVASADDSLFDMLKQPEAIGEHHLSPKEWLPEARSVISFFLPFTEAVRKSNHVKGLPSTEWLYARIEGEACNKALRKHLVQAFLDCGIKAVSPMEDPRFKTVNRRANWSERHAAYVAGLGTFSLSKSLITSKGSAGRVGSVIVDLSLEATPRPYTGLDEYCSMCKACIKRCPAQAISEKGKEHEPCSNFLDKVLEQFTPRYGCGKCQTAVPCEYKIPNK